MMRQPPLVSILMATAALGAPPADVDARSWFEVERSTDVSKLEAFISNHAASPYALLASNRIDQLEWRRIDKSNPAAIARFLRAHPDLDLEPPTVRSSLSLRVNSSVKQQLAARDFQRAMERLAWAYQSGSISDLRAAWPSISADSERSAQSLFERAKTVKVAYTLFGEARFTGDVAYADAWKEFNAIYDGKAHRSRSKIVVRFRQSGPAWVVDGVL